MTRASVNVLTHGYCMDGLVSALLFTRLLDRIRPEAERTYFYRSCGYGPKLKTIPKGWLAADVNAILDFRYTEDDRLTYYFDHHKTAFASPTEERIAKERVNASKGERTLHFDPSSTSCAKLISRVAAEIHGVEIPELASLARWADRVDAARFDDPEEAFFARAPELVLADVIERHGDTPFLGRIVPELLSRPLEDIVKSEDFGALARPLGAAKEVYLATLRRAGELRGDVAVVDLADATPTPAGKFATYVAFPTCRYSVALLRTKDQLKLGVGFNPWSGKERLHDIAAICQREGGGGHAVVGAVNFAHAEIDAARATLARVTKELGAPS